jgi:hypothetical protein
MKWRLALKPQADRSHKSHESGAVGGLPKHPDNDAVEAAKLRHAVARGEVLGITPRESCLLILDKANAGKVRCNRPT